MKIKNTSPFGENIIVHSARIKLGINCTEYCIFDTILSRKLKAKDTQFADIENYTGFEPEIIDRAIKNMEEIMLIKTVNNKYLINKKSITEAFSDHEDKLEKEFDQFWNLKIDRKDDNRWPGPRQASFDKYKIARKKYDFDYIIRQAKDYFRLLEHETWRKPMQATKFLNVKTAQVEEDFKSQWPDHFKEKKTETKILTKEEKENLFKQ